MFICFIINNLFDSSNLYHSIRSQSTLKLYVIFNVLEVLDKLFSSFGLDLIDSFFSQSSSVAIYFLTTIYIRKRDNIDSVLMVNTEFILF